MLLLKTLIKQQMKTLKMSYADIAIKTGIQCSVVRDLVENMQNHSGVMNLEKIMTVLDLFRFDNGAVDKAVRKELKKKEMTKDDYIY
jgi:hypothetical protein